MLNLAQARVIDPILTQIVQDYLARPTSGNALFPWVDVNVRGGQIIQFGKESFYLYNTRRAPGADVKVIDYGAYSGAPFVLETHDIDSIVPIEHLQDARAVPGIDLAQRAVTKTMDAILLNWENACATLATTPANYLASNTIALAGAAQWSNPAADPLAVVNAARERIRSQIGAYPNVAIMGSSVLAALQGNVSFKDSIKYTQRAVITADIIASLLNIPRIEVGTSVKLDEATGNLVDLWDKVFILAYVGTGNDHEAPSFGYTYRYRGHPQVETPWFDRVKKSWRYGTKLDRMPVIAGQAAGYLISNVIA